MSRNRIALASFLGLALTVPPCARAEAPNPFLPLIGERVRVSGPAQEPWSVEGTLVEAGIENLTLARPAAENYRRVSVPRAAVVRLEVSHGPRHRVFAGAAVGAAVGLAAGFSRRTCGLFANDPLDPGLPKDCRATNALLYAFGTAPVGALVGWLIKGERWEQKPIDRINLSVGPARGRGLQVLASFSY